jgi:hypothetical protein
MPQMDAHAGEFPARRPRRQKGPLIVLSSKEDPVIKAEPLPRGKRLPRQAARSNRAAGAHPLSLRRLHSLLERDEAYENLCHQQQLPQS